MWEIGDHPEYKNHKVIEVRDVLGRTHEAFEDELSYHNITEHIESPLVEWLCDRINKTSMEKDEAVDMNSIIGKGSKLCAYKEVLEWVRRHSI